VIKLLIASGRELDLGQPANENGDVVGRALRLGNPEIISLLESFRDHPGRTRHRVRLELGWADAVAAEVFAPVVFLSDDYFALKRNVAESSNRARRFFAIVRRLPMELQMLIARRAAGSAKDTISGRQVDEALKDLVRSL
jgi:hypothetical protein